MQVTSLPPPSTVPEPEAEPQPAWLHSDVLAYSESVYLQYLPAIYRQDAFIRNLLLIFESVLLPLEKVVGTLPLYTEPEMAPEEFLPWLAHWVALSLDSAWPVERQRVLIARAVEIYRWRGTRRGLKLHVEAYTGVEPLIQEYRDGFVLDTESSLGLTTRLITAPRDPFFFVVTVPVPDPQTLDPQVLHAIIDEEKPAHTTYQLCIVQGRRARLRHAAIGNGRPPT